MKYCGEFNNNNSGKYDNLKMIDNECCNELTKMNKNDEIPSKDLEVLEKSQKKIKITKTMPAMNWIWGTVKSRCKIKRMALTMKKR